MNQTTLRGYEDGFAEMEAKTIDDLKTVKHKVLFILERYPPTKGDDVLLLYRYYQHFGNGVSWKVSDFRKLLSLTAPESITRCRRKIQEGGEFLPSERVQRKRGRREEIIRGGIHDV